MSHATRPRPEIGDRTPPTPTVRSVEVLHAPAATRPDAAAELDRLCDLLANLYGAEAARQPGDAYLAEHGRFRVIRNQVRAFRWYRPHLPTHGAVLDWGCNHAPDSCLLRAWAGDRLDLHGCDFRPAGTFAAFHDFAGIGYTRLDDNLALPYPAGSFDAVVASGVLEHTAMDYEALKELYRVLKFHGTLIITYLPNWLSYQEWYLRTVKRKGFHRRRYGMRETATLLRRAGFEPVVADYHASLGERLLGTRGGVGRVLDTLVPLRRFSSTLRFVAKKVHGF